MAIGDINELEAKKMNHPEVKDATMKVAISPKEGWEDHVMRIMEVEPEGFTPKHNHPWPHINYVIQGNGTLLLDGMENPIKAGSYAFVPAEKLHQFKNTGSDTLKFICIVPVEGHQ
ncbi:cupin domain-containing protein [Isachenkonia alkalipeptolytica]|uniref:Cupin domain-containing protein n=1 Tax=Isachenkonia alkalipeptolytica TaxID=2565777 RepID=A0AA43XLC7_9CLOT|nr:cupin domain-containing protein [Isachenkonia alkalipeptolytica]NBG88431.1 cupin domain-containing protein [Isachenkonia alkalipeptolytica]